ncbi:MAG: DUF4865 family protein [Paraburkholderia tropica]|uniref:Uncharacterized protein DUF4865 n=1 Tax=Paraburkholderia tropica TaxID=92647 RepID=A0AAQ1GFV3_9BURK|nr:DUF4865 family protein [Paraburkholderia tropica]MBB3000590.1 hypothetical protein [Paraburkholderia tropica]MBB6320219.1 hypothetical protein [Paraburkholderia tropica]MDE1143712.1 DUF4865 family protein [Paraburkholderia tropica]PXX16929.1 uncharacterized protein DUF4865 [Paraburkholderia tropica]PZW83928.1 uncharacterized protein DUF4865 [Paraburkholderia tropica]
MLTVFYGHRLPSDYDTSKIHLRAKERGSLWDNAPDLFYKAFLLREAGRHGAKETRYASQYLWRHDAAFRDFLATGRYRNVTNSFGRAPIDAHSVLDASKGPARHARFAYIETIRVDIDADLDEAIANEITRNGETAAHADICASVVSLDVSNWVITRTLLSKREPESRNTHAGTPWQILHLAQPLLDTLATVAGPRI